MSRALKAFGLIFAGFVLAHWGSAGQDNIVNPPPQPETEQVVYK